MFNRVSNKHQLNLQSLIFNLLLQLWIKFNYQVPATVSAKTERRQTWGSSRLSHKKKAATHMHAVTLCSNPGLL